MRLQNKSFTDTLPPTDSSSSLDDIKLSYEELVLGVWRVLVVKDSRISVFNFRWEELFEAILLLRRAIWDVYIISPYLFALMIMSYVWSAIEGSLSLYLSNRLLFLIGRRIAGDFTTDQKFSDLHWAVICRIACSMLSACMKWSSRRNKLAHSSLVNYEYEARVFCAKLACDLPTSPNHSSPDINTNDVYRCLDGGIRLVNQVTSFLLHLRFIVHVIGSGLNDGGPVFVALCMFPPLMKHLMWSDLWTKAYVTSAANKFYIRKLALGKLGEEGLKHEVMAGGIQKFLTDEYHKAKEGLGDIPDTRPEAVYSQQRDSFLEIAMMLCLDIPMLYFAFLALVNPSGLSIVQLASLHEASSSLRSTFSRIGQSVEIWPSQFARLRNVYIALDTKNEMKDGETPFPRPGHETSTGVAIEVRWVDHIPLQRALMRLELRDVSFSYPNSKSERAALSGVSFTIQPGQLVVIVGANGSGKSTIIKLLSRFYEPTSGRILIDGIPIEEYRMDELRKGIAMLTQEHQLFPLSVEENIKLGSSEVEAMDDGGMVRESVLAAGAEGVMKNFNSGGYDTVLEPVKTGYISFAGKGNKELQAVHKSLDKPTSISGSCLRGEPIIKGEKQKLVAARTFMRLFTSPIKLVTVDEPSSALDPEAEYNLFSNLRQEKKGRTMILVTHRFGHLTKRADLIICIKAGVVVETGTHADLLSKEGEYAHLYNIQAQAYATT